MHRYSFKDARNISLMLVPTKPSSSDGPLIKHLELLYLGTWVYLVEGSMYLNNRYTYIYLFGEEC